MNLRSARPSFELTRHLAQLAGSGGAEHFVREVWGRAAGHAPGAFAGESAMLGIDDFEALAAHLFRPDEGWLHFAQETIARTPPTMIDAEGMIDLRGLRAAFVRGQTLYLTKAERLSPVLARWARRIAADFAYWGVALKRTVSAHLFLTPPGAQGFAPHRDAHASFVVQLAGSKDWQVYAPDAADGGSDDGPGPVSPNALAGRRPQTFRLAAGDVLFMPEWWPHAARAGDEASLHVTFRLFPLLGHVPQSCLNPADGLQADLEAILRDQRLPHRALPGRTLSAIARLGALAVDTRLERVDLDDLCECAADEEQAFLLFAGGRLSGPKAFLPVFEFVARQPVLRASDLPELDDAAYDRIELARALVSEGLFHFPEPGR